ncbi:hypothetical protein Cfor_04046 [Coptotermes formosanus]|uniref:C2 domain-containing protein n=1 Tax=Coptotermes formosanus TaxID=36987 RepID=A0A6L2PHP0_COPFO|nr:hypothetical protein Cfor_04046 [Coptotermes formosanus]
MAFLQNRSISLVDMYIDNTEPSENVGQIHFSLEYDFQNTTLILRILTAKELPAKDISGTSDPYVRVTLLPDKKHRLETKIKRRTLNPRWNETFYFEAFEIGVSRGIRAIRDMKPCRSVDLSEKPSFWKALKPPAKDKCGELLTSLCYHPSNSILTLTLLKARNLKAKDINGKSDPYVKVWLQFGDKRIEKRKTPIFKCTLNPIFNETFSFNVPWEKIRECSLDVMVMDFDNIGRNELIGRILLAAMNKCEGYVVMVPFRNAMQPLLVTSDNTSCQLWYTPQRIHITNLQSNCSITYTANILLHYMTDHCFYSSKLPTLQHWYCFIRLCAYADRNLPDNEANGILIKGTCYV